MQVAGIKNITLYENKDVAFSFPDISIHNEVNSILNSGTVDEINFCNDAKFKREIKRGENNKKLYTDTIEFYINDFTDVTLAIIKRLQVCRTGYIAKIEFLSGQIRIMQMPFFFNETERDFISDSYVLRASYRVNSNFNDLILVAKALPILNLFYDFIDFEANTIPDKESLNDSEFSGSAALVLLTNAAIQLNRNIPNTTDFTYFIKLVATLDYPNRVVYLDSNDNTFGEIRLMTNVVSQNYLTLYVGGTAQRINVTNWVQDELHTLTLRRSGNTWSIWRNGIKVGENTFSATFADFTGRIGAINQGNGQSWIHAIGIIEGTLSDADILAIGNNAENIRGACIDAIGTYSSYFYSASENYENKIYDIIRGEFGTCINYVPEQRILIEDKIFFNQKYGFELYTEDAGSNKIFVPLKYDGTSIGEVISGYTSQGIVSQDNKSFLNCETKIIMKEPLNEAVINADYSGVFHTNGTAKEVSFSELKAGISASSYLSAGTNTDNIIFDLKLFEE